jgi:hypothetical protein
MQFYPGDPRGQNWMGSISPTHLAALTRQCRAGSAASAANVVPQNKRGARRVVQTSGLQGKAGALHSLTALLFSSQYH